MNVIPDEFIRVMPDALRGFISEAFPEGRTSEEDAAHMDYLLVLTRICAVCSVTVHARHRDMWG